MLSICADAYYGLITSHKGRGNVPECSKRVLGPLIYLRYEGFFNIFQHNSEFYSPEIIIHISMSEYMVPDSPKGALAW